MRGLSLIQTLPGVPVEFPEKEHETTTKPACAALALSIDAGPEFGLASMMRTRGAGTLGESPSGR